MKKLILPLITIVLLASCGGNDAPSNEVPQPQSMEGVHFRTTIVSGLDYQKNPSDELQVLVFDLKEFYLYTKFTQIPAGQHKYQYTFWQEGQPYHYSPTAEEGPAEEGPVEEPAMQESVEEAMEEEAAAGFLPGNLLVQNTEGSAENTLRYYKSGTLYFDTKGATMQNVWHQFTTEEALNYGAGTYLFDVYLDDVLIERKEIKVLSKEEKASGEYQAYWLAKDLYAQFTEPSDGKEKVNEWSINYFYYQDKPIEQVIIVPHNSFNRVFAVVKEASSNNDYSLMEFNKKDRKVLKSISNADVFETRFQTKIVDNDLYFYNAFNQYNIKLNLISGDVENVTKLPFDTPSHRKYPSSGGGKTAERSCSGSISLNGSEVHTYESEGNCGWISWDNTSDNFYFDAKGIYQYNVSGNSLKKVVFNQNAKGACFFSNNGMNFIAYAEGNNIMIATNEKRNPGGGYFDSEYGNNTVELNASYILDQEELTIEYMEDQTLLSREAFMEMEGFNTVVTQVGKVAGGNYHGAQLLRFQLDDVSEEKGSTQLYYSNYFGYALAKGDSLIFLRQHLITKEYGQFITVQGNTIKLTDPGYTFGKTDFLAKYKNIFLASQLKIPRMEIKKEIKSEYFNLSLVATNCSKKLDATNYKTIARVDEGDLLISSENDDGSFKILHPDGSWLVYTYNFNGRILNNDLSLNIDRYVPYTDRTCDGSSTDLACIMQVGSSELVQIGTYSGHPIFRLNGKDHELLKKEFDRYEKGAVSFSEYSDYKVITFQEFISSTPIFFWKDLGDRYVRFINQDFLTPLMCEPILYVYPEHEQLTNISLDKKVDVFASYPSYQKGWELVAHKDGRLEDLNSRSKEHRLFWEGASDMLPALEKGYVVQRKDVNAFLDEKLAYLGLNEMETNEFKEAWAKYLVEKEYCFVGFYDQDIIDRIAPMNISPKPDQIVRILMDYRTLDAFEKVEAPDLKKAPKREGYVVVEWGGLKR